MRIVSHRTLVEYYTKHSAARVGLERWYDVAEKANWKCFADIKRDFPSVDYVGNDRYVFNIKGNTFRLIVLAIFTRDTLLIRSVGTHAEYDKIDCSKI